MGLPFPFQLAQINASGQVRSVALAEIDPVPAGAQIAGGIAFSQNGEVYVSNGTGSPAGAIHEGGLLHRGDGVLLVSNTAPVVPQHLHGYLLRQQGRIMCAVGTPANYQNGVPFDANGWVCISTI